MHLDDVARMHLDDVILSPPVHVAGLGGSGTVCPTALAALWRARRRQ